ncbi:hypothetical protein K491DRAFT_473063 [Lophiostoma macrostomum CBS 122681]|uniref:Heterokaryon incompatibility domain-containing protein n=1 Tax=Lophiostoma macrostomum CBS 122681 TaxID=1314788 RepID=A0A6A6T466_9PLEO|nr:hypothetical protein K491DRAFT_473063 [Lophiostoma macrostomum CBS 122681]
MDTTRGSREQKSRCHVWQTCGPLCLLRTSGKSASVVYRYGQDIPQRIRSGWTACSCRGVNPMDLEYLIGLTYLRTLAKDPRDRFYALLSFATNEDWLALTPDYTLSREDVFLRATLHLMRKKSSLDILQMGENLCRCEEDPSWLPGWDQGARSLKVRELMKGGGAAAGIPFSLGTNEDLRVLTVTGLVIGKVVSMVPFSSSDGSPSPMSMSSYQWFEMLDEFATIAASDPFRRPPAAMLQLGMPYSDRRCFFATNNGHIGFGPDHVQKLDIVALIGGASTPICLTPIDGLEGQFRWVGAAFVYKAMRGELVREQTATHSGFTKFEIH